MLAQLMPWVRDRSPLSFFSSSYSYTSSASSPLSLLTPARPLLLHFPLFLLFALHVLLCLLPFLLLPFFCFDDLDLLLLLHFSCLLPCFFTCMCSFLDLVPWSSSLLWLLLLLLLLQHAHLLMPYIVSFGQSGLRWRGLIASTMRRQAFCLHAYFGSPCSSLDFVPFPLLLMTTDLLCA